MTRSWPFALLAVTFALPARAGLLLEFEEGAKHTTVEMDGKKFRSTELRSREERLPGFPRDMPADPDDGDAGPPPDDATDDDSTPAEPPAPPPRRAARRPHVTIFDGDKQVLYVVDDEQKTYQRTDERSAAEVARVVKETTEKLRAKLTPEQRAQLDASLAKQKADAKQPVREPTWKFERASGGRRVAGFACDNYRILRDGKPSSEACFIPWGTGGFTKSDFQSFQEMGRFIQKLARSMAEAFGQQGWQGQSDEWISRFVDTAPGFPAVMKNTGQDATDRDEMRLVKIQRASVPGSRFALPAEYREKKFSVE